MIPPPSTSIQWLYWAAAFIDGEGHFGIQKCNLTVVATQKDPELLYRLRAMFGGGTIRGRQRGIHAWVLCGAAAVGVAMTLYPMMSQKRQREIRRALERWRSGRLTGLTVFERPVLRDDTFFAWCQRTLDERAVGIIAGIRRGQTQMSMAPALGITWARINQIVRAALRAYQESLGINDHPGRERPVVHGTLTAYVNRHCRCTLCRTTYSAYQANLRRVQ